MDGISPARLYIKDNEIKASQSRDGGSVSVRLYGGGGSGGGGVDRGG